MNETTGKKPGKIFISHSSQDLAFVQSLVKLFEHIGLTQENMFCSSVGEYDVPLDKNIYDYLKEQFRNYDLRVIFVLSENYYKSSASLNEMGAAWALQHKYTSVLPDINSNVKAVQIGSVQQIFVICDKIYI